MWSRVVEVMLGVWLVISPFVFAHPPSNRGWWINDMATGTVVIVLGLFSFWHPARWAHLAILAVAAWLVGFAYFHGFGDASAASQNHLTIGLMLIMFAILPNEASLPPESWEARRSASD